MNEDQLKAKVRQVLGEGVVAVELTSNQLTQVLDDAYRWFNARKGILEWKSLDMTANVTEYALSSEVYGVTDVAFPASGSAGSGTSDIFDASFWAIQGSFSSGGDYGYCDARRFAGVADVGKELVRYLQESQLNETRRKIYGSEWIWEFDRKGRILRISPSPSIDGELFYRGIFGITSDTIDELFPDDMDMVYRYTLARSKQVVGAIRRKFSSLPAPGGEVSMDGDTLVTEGNEAIELLHEEIANSQGPMGFLMG